MEVFYNPVMASNRNLSVLLLNCLPNKEMNIADPLAGSGIRSLRFLKELKKGKIKTLFVNDAKDNFPNIFASNLKLNKISKSKNNQNIVVGQEDASLFLLHHPGFDYIDIDPFGSPNPFLAAAVARISRGGILAITATDTAALTGTYPKVTLRKYWATALKNYMMHETGIRILIRKVQLQGIQFDKALVPILAYSREHYFRIYFINQKGKEKCDKIIKQHQYLLFCSDCLSYQKSTFNKNTCECGHDFTFAGPLWTGDIFDKKLITLMVKNNPFPEEQKFLELLQQEADVVGFYDLHVLAKKNHKEPPKMETALRVLKGTRTHFCLTGVKTEKSISGTKSLF